MNIMILFFISLFMIFLSSYLLSSVLDKKNCANGFIYLFLIIFSQIILTSEILSLFSALKPIPFLIFNIIFLLISILIHKKNNAGFWHIDLKLFFTRLFNTLKLDKTLIILLFGWLFFIIIALFSNTILPIMEADAKSYHVLRSVEWVLAGNLNHFNTVDVRNIIFPINSEIIYSWIIMFTKKNIFLGYLSFFSYFLCLTCLYKIIHSIMGFSLRKTVWTLLILSSFAFMFYEITSCETDVLISGLLLSSIYLFWNGIKNDKENTFVYMSALSCAIALGSKTSAFFNIPAIGLFFLFLSYKNKKYKPFLKFLLFSFINFLIFSSYNYILNFIDFNNFFAPKGEAIAQRNNYGIKGGISYFIKYFFLLFDFTGFKFIKVINDLIYNIQSFLLNTFNVQDIPASTYTQSLNKWGINQSTIGILMGTGVLGFLLYIPSLIYSFIKFIFKKDNKTLFVLTFGVMFLISIISMSYVFMYTAYGVRYLNTMIIISAPVIVYSYIKNNFNPIKYIFIMFAMFYYIWLPLHLPNKPILSILPDMIKHNYNLTLVRQKSYCFDYLAKGKYLSYLLTDEVCSIYSVLKENFNSKKNKILIFPSNIQNDILKLKLASLNKEFFLTVESFENINNINFKEYNILITANGNKFSFPYTTQISDYIKNYSINKVNYHTSKSLLEHPLQDILHNAKNNEDCTCMYISVNGKVISKEHNNINDLPFIYSCIISDTFYKKHHFVHVFRFKSYDLYVNSLNLPHTKKLH